MTQWPENAAYRLLQQSERALEERGNAQRLGTCDWRSSAQLRKPFGLNRLQISDNRQSVQSAQRRSDQRLRQVCCQKAHKGKARKYNCGMCHVDA